MSQSCPTDIDRSFGPWAGPSCRGGFDFTLMFEESILTIPLQCLFLSILPYRAWQLTRTNKKVTSNLQGILKLCLAACVAAVSVALLGLWASGSSTTQTQTTIPAAVLVFIASLGLCMHTWLEHDRNIKPSFILFAYLFLSVILDLARCRTLWMTESTTALPALFTIALTLRFILLLVESVGKRHFLVAEFQGWAKETTASTLSRGTFFWLNTLFIRGYKNNLALEDLDSLNPKLDSATLHRAYQDAWDQVPDKTVQGALYSTWIKVFFPSVMTAFIPKLIQIGFIYTQPFLIQEGIKLASMPSGMPYDNWGYGLIGAYIIVYTGIAVATGQYDWRAHRTGSIMRGGLVGMIYQKSLRLDITAPDVSPEGALTLATTDVETAMMGVVYFHDIWAAFLEIGVGTFLIYRLLGPACAMPLAIVLVALVISAFIAMPIGKAQAAWIQASQDRVTLTSKTLGSIKSLKISGLSGLTFSMIQKLRKKELQVSERYRKLLAGTLVLMICIPVWSPVMTFCVFAAQGVETLDFEKAFTSLALLSLVNRPLTSILYAVPILATSMTSVQRIQNFLNGEERHDKRIPARGEDDVGVEKTWHESGKVDVHDIALEGGSPAHLEEGIIASIQGKLSWSDESAPVINIDKWDIQAKTFTLLLGPVGCGKSTLLKTLLGELSGFQGTVRTNFARVGYCSQTAWLPNETVRDIIVGFADFDEAWYRQVLKACALEQDIREWPRGEDTIAGTMGISMSGGQRHRLSIARALYSRAEFLILDDPFSGLDAETEDIIFHNLLGDGGLLRLAEMTVVLASSDVRRAPYADQIVLLSEKGQIDETGSPETLGPKLGTATTSQGPLARTEDTAPAGKTQEHEGGRSVGAGQTTVADMEYQAQAARRLGDSKIYGFYAGAVGWVPLTLFVMSMAVFAFCGSFPNIWLKWWAEANLTESDSNLGKWLGVYVALGVGSVLSVLFGSWELFISVINNSGVYFHNVLVEATSKASLAFHTTVDSGVTVNRFSQDLQLIDMELPATALGLAVGVAFGIAEFVMIAVSSRYIGVILPFLIFAFYTIQHFYLRTSRQIRLLDIELKAPLYTQLIKTIDGLVTIRAFQWQDNYEEKNMELLNNSQRPSYLLYCIQRWLTFSVDMMIAAIALILIVITTTLREQIGPGYMGIALSNILSFSETVKAALTSWVMLEIAISAVARIRAFSQTTEVEARPDEPLKEPQEDWPSQGGIELRGLTASYPSSGTVLHDVDLSIKPGQKVAICGRSGSGKSSLVLCILRLMHLDSGSITVDDIDLSTVPHEYIRSQLTTVPQDAYIFDGTVRLNVDPEETATDDEIKQVLDKVQLWTKVEQRGGLDAAMNDKFFSQGEMQLLVFARAMLRKSKVLILDEFTSSLDDDTSAIVYDVLDTWCEGRTVISIAHKLDSILGFDRVAVMSSGRLVEFDEPKKLLEQQDSAFKKLFESSTRKGE